MKAGGIGLNAGTMSLAVWPRWFSPTFDTEGPPDRLGFDIISPFCPLSALSVHTETVVKLDALSMFTGWELERQVCGDPTVDMNALCRCLAIERGSNSAESISVRGSCLPHWRCVPVKEGLQLVWCPFVYCLQTHTHTHTHALTRTHTHTTSCLALQFLFEVLDNFSPLDRRLFLKFISGRSRLPASAASSITMHVCGNGKPDGTLPTAATCYQKLYWPNYTNVEAARDRLKVSLVCACL